MNHVSVWPREDRIATHLVVLVVPPLAIVVVLLPLLVLWDGVEGDFLLAFPDLDDGSDELDKEPRDLEKGRVEGVKEVDDQALDVRSIVILIG
jgi:hypothetical protein